MKKPDAILFDWDGTLLDSLDFCLGAHNYVREKLGGYKPFVKEDLFGKESGCADDRYRDLYGDRSQEALGILDEYIRQNHLKRIKSMEKAEKLLGFISSRNIPVGLVSNKRHDDLVREVEHLGWTHFFGSIVGAGRANRNKPEADPLHLAVDQLFAGSKVEDPHIYYAGDSEIDLVCAGKYGCPAILVTNNEDKRYLIEEYSPEIVACDLEDLIKKLACIL